TVCGGPLRAWPQPMTYVPPSLTPMAELLLGLVSGRSWSVTPAQAVRVGMETIPKNRRTLGPWSRHRIFHLLPKHVGRGDFKHRPRRLSFIRVSAKSPGPPHSGKKRARAWSPGPGSSRADI